MPLFQKKNHARRKPDRRPVRPLVGRMLVRLAGLQGERFRLTRVERAVVADRLREVAAKYDEKEMEPVVGDGELNDKTLPTEGAAKKP